MFKKNLAFAIGILLFCILMYMETFRFASESTLRVGPQVYPRILLAVLACLTGVYIMKEIVMKAISNKTQEENKEKKHFNWRSFFSYYYKTFFVFVLFALYIFLLNNVGFIISSLIFLFIGQTLLMKMKSIKLYIINVSVTFVATFFIFIVFTEVLGVRLP